MRHPRATTSVPLGAPIGYGIPHRRRKYRGPTVWGMKKSMVFLYTWLLLIAVPPPRSFAASVTATPESEEDRLATEVEDPTAILTQLQFQDIYTPRNFQTSAQTNTVQLRPVIPVAPF